MVADEDALWLGVVTVIVTLTWSYHWVRALHRWGHERSFSTSRAAFVSTMLIVGLVRIAVGSFVRAAPTVGWLVFIQSALAPLLTLFLFTGGVVMIVLWMAEDRAARRRRD